MEPAPGWHPTASVEVLWARARLYADVRAFFAARGVLEVETPLLGAAGTTDPHLDSFVTTYTGPGASAGDTRYLQTSPEFAMKRLLAADSGPIYQICKAFRNGEAGRRHNPEFTLLEWYRPGYDHHALMDEVEALLQAVAGQPSARRLTYQDVFVQYADIDPFVASPGVLRGCAERHGLHVVGMDGADQDAWLDLLLTHLVEPQLGVDAPLFVYDYPPSQAMLARIRPGTPAVAERFELYIHGIELANGFHELGDAAEQARRFEHDRVRRRQVGIADVTPDVHLLTALAAGLPACSGVALGLDRLLLATLGAKSLHDVISFPWGRS